MKIHPTQKLILEQLRLVDEGLRYAKIKPSRVENDLYNYHLQYLVKQGLVDKQAGKYGLTQGGKQFLMELNPLDKSGVSNRFKVAAMCLVLQERDDQLEVLYQERTRQPFKGHQDLIAGGVKKGEPVEQAASRRLKEEAGLEADFKAVGVLRKTWFDEAAAPYSDIFYHVCVATNVLGSLSKSNKYGKHFWLSLEQAVNTENSEVNGSKQLATLLKAIKPDFKSIPAFFIEEIYTHQVR